MAQTEAQIRASAKYKAKLHRIELCYARDEYLEDLINQAKIEGIPTVTFVKRLVKEYMEEKTGKQY